MAADLERLARYLRQHPGGSNIAGIFDSLAGVARQLGVPESFETPQPRGIEIPGVNEETYLKTREAVEATGYTFVAAIRSVSVEDLLAEDNQRKQKGKSGRFGYVNDSKTMRATVPPEMEIVINPNSVRIKGSNNLSTNDQKARIGKEEASWKKGLPEDVRPFVRMCMVDPSTLCQLEDAYMDEKGKLLFPDYFVRTDVETVSGYVADVGRTDPADQRDVFDWYRAHGARFVFAVSVVVLPRKLSV